MTRWNKWFPWRKPVTDSVNEPLSKEETPLREIRPLKIFAFGGNATLGAKRTVTALETAGLTEYFCTICATTEKALGLASQDALLRLAEGSPAQMQCAFAVLKFAALERAIKEYGMPDLYTGFSVGNALACFAGLGVNSRTAASYLYQRGHFMQTAGAMVGMYGPPYNNLATVDLSEGGREQAHEVQEALGHFGGLAGVAIYRHGGVTVCYLGSIEQYDLARFGAVKPLGEMAYHLPYVMEHAAALWRRRLEPLCHGPMLHDRFWSGKNGHATTIGPSRRERIDAICEELCTSFGWDMICDQIRHGDSIFHLGVRVGKREVDLLRGITPLPSDVTWQVVTA